MKVPAIVICLLLRLLSIAASRVYSCPTGCRCTILKRQRDRVTAATSEQSVAPGRKVVCQSSSPLITSVSQIPLDNLPRDTLHLYVIWHFILCCLLHSHYILYCVWSWKREKEVLVWNLVSSQPLLSSLVHFSFPFPLCPLLVSGSPPKSSYGVWRVLLPLII